MRRQQRQKLAFLLVSVVAWAVTIPIVLVIGLIAYLGYSYLNTQIDKTANKMEAASADFLDILQEPTR